MRLIRYEPRLNSTRMEKRAGLILAGGGTPLSYLLTEGKFCRALIDPGCQDALQRRDEILRFLDAQPRRDDEMP